MQSIHIQLRNWIIPVLVLVVVVVGALIYANLKFVESAPIWSDLLVPWNASSQWMSEGMNPYSEQVRLQAQELLYQRPAVVQSGEHGAQLAIPLPSLLLMLPLGLLPYDLARAVVMTFVELAFVATVLLGVHFSGWKARWPVFVLLSGFALLWMPGIQSIVTANIRVLSFLVQLLSLIFFWHGRDLLAGLLTGLAAAGSGAVFPLVIYMTVWGLREGRLNYLVGWLTMMTGLVGLSFLVLPQWLDPWLQELLRWLVEEKGLAAPAIDLNVFNPFPFSPIFSIGLGGMVLVYLLYEWTRSLGKGVSWFQWTALITIVLSQFLMLFPDTGVLFLLIPGVCLVFSSGSARWGKTAVWALAGLLLFLLAASWLVLYLSAGGEQSVLVTHGPALLVAVAMWWIRWWSVRGGISLPMDYLKITDE